MSRSQMSRLALQDSRHLRCVEGDIPKLRLVLRAVCTAPGGTHDDWDTDDRVMREDTRTTVLLPPTRVYSNPA